MFFPFRNIRQKLAGRVIAVCFERLKDTDLILFPLRSPSYGHCSIKDCKQLRPSGPCSIKCPALDERLDRPIIDFSKINPFAEIKYRTIPAAFISYCDDGLYRRFADVLDSD